MKSRGKEFLVEFVKNPSSIYEKKSGKKIYFGWKEKLFMEFKKNLINKLHFHDHLTNEKETKTYGRTSKDRYNRI